MLASYLQWLHYDDFMIVDEDGALVFGNILKYIQNRVSTFQRRQWINRQQSKDAIRHTLTPDEIPMISTNPTCFTLMLLNIGLILDGLMVVVFVTMRSVTPKIIDLGLQNRRVWMFIYSITCSVQNFTLSISSAGIRTNVFSTSCGTSYWGFSQSKPAEYLGT
ncbi:hypothetical protein PHMEG_00017894 [Phytophthora megakarya]|uniref:Uncharacterized protein n=1 Tax=Phytophthora megakarya TaxID=4795 RepID=A0A225VVE4_9STRA|nr:hypothetical protein PHMEG_00017894 [Phytophthora megakarya]